MYKYKRMKCILVPKQNIAISNKCTTDYRGLKGTFCCALKIITGAHKTILHAHEKLPHLRFLLLTGDQTDRDIKCKSSP